MALRQIAHAVSQYESNAGSEFNIMQSLLHPISHQICYVKVKLPSLCLGMAAP